MNSQMAFGGFLMSDGVRRQLPVIISPNREDVAHAIRIAVDVGVGILVMRKTPEPEVGAYELSMKLDTGHYFLALSVLDSEGETLIRTPSGKDVDPGLRDFLGNSYSGSKDLSSIEFAQAAFEAFLITGDVPLEMLS